MPIIGPRLQESCPRSGHWASFRLVDEIGAGEPYSRLHFKAYDSEGHVYSGETDEKGFAKLDDFYHGPLFIDLSTPCKGAVDPWYDILMLRDKFRIPLTAIQIAAEQTPAAHRKPGDPHLPQLRAKEEKAIYHHVEVSDFVLKSAAAHLPEHTLTQHAPNALRAAEFHQMFKARGEEERAGIALEPCQHHVIEVKALRAYSPIFSRDKAFCALNCYHLALMSTFVYAPFNVKRGWDERPEPPPYKGEIASIGKVLHNQLAHLEKPTMFNDAGPYHLLCEEVPYSKRLEVMPWDNVRYAEEKHDGWEYPEDVHYLHHKSDTQAFITHNDKVILISIRGTEGLFWDGLRDVDARQIPHADGLGQAHRGFHEAFVSTKKFISDYMNPFHSSDQTIIVSGHSLGGAIAVLVAEWIRREFSNDVQLYTYGAPRVGDATFVREAKDLTHHRIVNHFDPIPGVPSTWMDAEWKLVVPGTAMMVASIGTPIIGAAVFLGGLLNLRGDDYEHHGEQRHFMPRKPHSGGYSSILWKPGCDALEQKICAEFAGNRDLNGDMPSRSLLTQMASMGEHSSNAGYSRAALTTLLRWSAAALQRNGTLFTEDERKDLRDQIKPIAADLGRWAAPTYLQFRKQVRTTTHPRLSRLTEVELRATYDKSQRGGTELQHEQLLGLTKAQKRLKSQATVVVTLKDVFGDQAEREDITQLLEEWLALTDVQKAAKLAKVSLSSPQQLA